MLFIIILQLIERSVTSPIPIQLAAIDEQIFSQVLQQPWDGLIHQPSLQQLKKLSNPRPCVQLGDGQALEDVVVQLEADLRFLWDGSGKETAATENNRPKRRKLREQLMKVMPVEATEISN